jgi:hypothetical protein
MSDEYRKRAASLPVSILCSMGNTNIPAIRRSSIPFGGHADAAYL